MVSIHVRPMDDATAASALSGFSQKLNSIAAQMRQSFTYDQGKALSSHKELAARTGVAVYFCDTHSPWQRVTRENTDGLLRQYLPKGTDLSVCSQEQLDAIADSLNTRPCATHGFQLPLVVFGRMPALTPSGIHFNSLIQARCTWDLKPPRDRMRLSHGVMRKSNAPASVTLTSSTGGSLAPFDGHRHDQTH